MTNLLKDLCAIASPSGDEGIAKAFVLDYVAQYQAKWRCQPIVIADDSVVHDGLILVFGKPRVAVYAHMDVVGFTTRYDNKLVPIGAPDFENGDRVIGRDSGGTIEAALVHPKDSHLLCLDTTRPVARGTTFTYQPEWEVNGDLLTTPYLDNRVGMYTALRLAETMENGALVFTCYEEHGGGSAGMLAKLLWEQYQVGQSLIADITWVTEGVAIDEGPAVSMRDMRIPRRSYLNKVIAAAEASGVPFQLEVEAEGGSDGAEIQRLPYPIDWCFVGAPIENAHTPHETISLTSLEQMVQLYQFLVQAL